MNTASFQTLPITSKNFGFLQTRNKEAEVHISSAEPADLVGDTLWQVKDAHRGHKR